MQDIQSIGNAAERTAQVKFLHEKAARAKNVHHSMKVELQDVEAANQKKYEKKVNDLERRLKKVQADLRAAKNSAVSPTLRQLLRFFSDKARVQCGWPLAKRADKLAGNVQQKADLVDGASPSMKDPGLLEDQEMLDEAARIQGKDKQAARRMLKMVTQTEDIAASTMDTMKNQTEQISKIHADLEEMDSTLKLADQQIKQYVRKMATDKLIMAMLFLIVMGLVVIMVLKTLGFFSDDQVHVPHEVTDSAKDMIGRRALRSTILSAVPVSGREASPLVDYML